LALSAAAGHAQLQQQQIILQQQQQDVCIKTCARAASACKELLRL
jgi:hypothetical protein